MERKIIRLFMYQPYLENGVRSGVLDILSILSHYSCNTKWLSGMKDRFLLVTASVCKDVLGTIIEDAHKRILSLGEEYGDAGLADRFGFLFDDGGMLHTNLKDDILHGLEEFFSEDDAYVMNLDRYHIGISDIIKEYPFVKFDDECLEGRFMVVVRSVDNFDMVRHSMCSLGVMDKYNTRIQYKDGGSMVFYGREDKGKFCLLISTVVNNQYNQVLALRYCCSVEYLYYSEGMVHADFTLSGKGSIALRNLAADELGFDRKSIPSKNVKLLRKEQMLPSLFRRLCGPENREKVISL